MNMEILPEILLKPRPPGTFLMLQTNSASPFHTDNHQYCVIVGKEIQVGLTFFLSVSTKFGHAGKNCEYIKLELKNSLQLNC